MGKGSGYDVIVVGVGAMGSSACYHLAGRGAKVLGLEQFDIPHALGSSHGYSRMIRMAYYEHPDYVPLLRRAYELWRELEAASGQTLFHEVGGVYMGPPTGHVVAGATEAARRHGLAHEVLSQTGLMAHANKPAGGLTLLDRKRLELARALATRPRLLLLDEIAGGLTEHEALQLVAELKRIKAQGVTMIWIEHVVHALMALADRLLVVNFGSKLAEGEPHAVMNDPQVRRVYMGVEAQ